MNLSQSKKNSIKTKEDIRKIIDRFNVILHAIVGPTVFFLVVVISIVAILWSKSAYSNQIAEPNQRYWQGWNDFYEGNLDDAKVSFETAKKNGFSLRECDGYILLIDKISQTYQAPNTNTNVAINAFREVQSDDASLDANLHWLIACEALEQTLKQCEANYSQFESSSDIEEKLLELQKWNEKKQLPDTNEQVQFWLHRALYAQAKANYQLALNEYWNSINVEIEERLVQMGKIKISDFVYNHTVSQTTNAKDYAQACNTYIETLCAEYKQRSGNQPINDKNKDDLTHLIEKIEVDSFSGNNNFYDKDFFLKQHLIDEYFPPDEYYAKIKYLQGCYRWNLEWWMSNEPAPNTGVDKVLTCWYTAAYYGSSEATERLSEIYFYGLSCYCESKWHPKIQNDGISTTLAMYAAKCLGNPHAYTILARIANKNNREDEVTKYLETARNNGDRAVGWVSVILLHLEGDDAYNELANDENKSGNTNNGGPYDDPYTLNCMGLISGNEKYWKDSVKMGCEVAAYNLSDYYANKDGTLSRLYAELALHQRDINFNNAWEFYNEKE